MKCGICRQEGHNRRSCPQKDGGKAKAKGTETDKHLSHYCGEGDHRRFQFTKRKRKKLSDGVYWLTADDDLLKDHKKVVDALAYGEDVKVKGGYIYRIA